MGNLENENDIEERASVKTITSDINASDNNSLKSVKVKLNDDGKKHATDLQNGDQIKVIVSDENNVSENTTPSNESEEKIVIDTNAEVHAEDESSKTDDLNNSSPEDETQQTETEAHQTETTESHTNEDSETNETNTSTEIPTKETETEPDSNAEKSNNESITENGTSETEEKVEESISPEESDENKTSVHDSDANDSSNEVQKENDEIKPVETELEAKSGSDNKQEQINNLKNSPLMTKHPFKRSVSDNFLIKSTNIIPHSSLIDPVNPCSIEIDNDVLIQNNINLYNYKTDETLENLTKLQMLKRSINETLSSLKSKLLRNNKIKNGSDQNVKLINVESPSTILDADEDEMIENIQTPAEMKNQSMDSEQDVGEVMDREEAWKVERDMQNGVDVLRR